MNIYLFARNIHEVDKRLIDPWSGIHAASGILLSNLHVSDSSKIFITILWELIENSNLGPMIWKHFYFDDYTGDSWSNILSDVLFVYTFSQIKSHKPLLFVSCLIYYKAYYYFLN